MIPFTAVLEYRHFLGSPEIGSIGGVAVLSTFAFKDNFPKKPILMLTLKLQGEEDGDQQYFVHLPSEEACSRQLPTGRGLCFPLVSVILPCKTATAYQDSYATLQ